MRKVVLLMHLSLDGYVADVNGGLDWMSYDNEMAEYAEEVVATVGAALYGRTTYHLMESYWPTVLENPGAGEHSLNHARWVQDIPKIVFQGASTK